MEHILLKELIKPSVSPVLKLHFYGKKFTKPQRKLGHFTITAEKIEEALSRAKTVGNLLRVVKQRGSK